MSSAHQLQIINPDYNHQKHLTFTPFSRLPTEIRIEIWKQSLQRQRLISLTTKRAPIETEQQYTRAASEEGREGAIEPPYWIMPTGEQILSKLMRVSCEAREVALRFYRVHLPCRLYSEKKNKYIIGTLYLSPEYDILWLHAGELGSGLPRLLVDLHALDPLGVGILSVAFDADALQLLNTMEVFAPFKQAIIIDMLSRLQEVFFVYIKTRDDFILGQWTYHSKDSVIKYECDRSRPIMSPVATFDRIQRDPRESIAHELGNVYLGYTDARSMGFSWKRYLHEWGIHHPQDSVAKYQLLVSSAFMPYHQMHLKSTNTIRDRQSAVKWVQRRYEMRLRTQQRAMDHLAAGKGTAMPIESTLDLELKSQPAIGFWLFPVEALSRLQRPDEGEETIHWIQDTGFHMRASWPELCLTHLPN